MAGARERVEAATRPRRAAKVETPECDRIAEVREQSQTCGEFLEWLEREKGWHLPPYSTSRLLAEYFGIDLTKADDERRAILAALRGEDER